MEIKPKKTLSIEDLNTLSKEKNAIDQDSSKNNEGNDSSSSRFHLPVLYINDPTQWPSKPMEERRHFTDELAQKTCLGNCCGVKGLKAGCCYLDPTDLEHVLGPVDEDWIRNIIKWFNSKNIYVKRSDIVIDAEEGKLIGETFFGGHPVFNSPGTYPILRFKINGPRFSCVFLTPETGMCTIYHQRSDMCRNYLCLFIKTSFLVRTSDHPNTYQKVQ